MSLDIPDLDDRRYQAIVEDARKRIPVYTEQWTDHNASDPGITILELFAWLAETYTYQLNRVTDAHRLKYLALLGEKPRLPRPASVDLVAEPPSGIASIRIPAGQKLIATDDAGVPYGFETTRSTRPTTARLVRVVTDGDRGRVSHETANETPGMHFAAFGESVTEGSRLYLGFDANPFDRSSELLLAVRLHEADLPEPATHGEAADAWTSSDGVEPADHRGLTDPRTATGEFAPSVEVEWQHCVDYDNWHRDWSGDTEDGNDDAPEPVWEPIPVEDETNRFYRSGFVSVAEPADWTQEPDELFEPDGQGAYWWIRCVVTTAGYEIAPLIDSIAVNVVPVEHRWTVDTGDGDPEPLVDADGNSESTGLPNQTFAFTLPFDPPPETGRERQVGLLVDEPKNDTLDDESAEENADGESTEDTDECKPTVEVLVDDVPWERRDDFDGSGPHSTHYVLDPARGTVRFGDGSRGKLPPAGALITTTGYVTGGGSAGNLPASSTWSFEGAVNGGGQKEGSTKLDPSRLRFEQPAQATGGTDAESIEAAFDRLAEDRAVPYRGVSLDDYEYLATHTPGLRFGRAAARVVVGDRIRRTPPRREDTGGGTRTGTGPECWGPADEGPEIREGDRARPSDEDDATDTAAYCEPHREIRVVVVPYSRSHRPEPSDGFRDAVQCHLDRHRLLTDRVVVERPSYVTVGVDVEVRLESAFGAAERRAAVVARLDEFLNPLRGFEGDGWPFGRTLYRSELYEVIEGVTGVDCVTGLEIRAADGGTFDGDGNLDIAATALLTPGTHTVTAQDSSSATNERCP